VDGLAGAASTAVWVPRGARVQAVTVSDGAASQPAPWRAAGPDALLVETGPPAREACASFDVRGPGAGLAARFVAPDDLDGLNATLAPPAGRVLEIDGRQTEPASLEGRPAYRLAAGPLARGETIPLRVVDAGRVGEVPLLLTIGGLALAVLAGTLLWHLTRPPLAGKPAERFFEHLAELQARIVPPAVAFALLNVLYFTTGLRALDVAGWTVLAPTFGVDASVSSRAFDAFAERLVPEGVTLVALHPVDAVLAQVQTSLFLAFLTVLPLILYEVGAFVAPALEPRERRVVLAVVPVLTGLFLVGALFGYLAMAPLMLTTLYGYAPALEATPLLGVGDLVSIALLLMLAFGLAFELPVAMYALARLGVVKPGTFLRYFRHAVLVIVILAGILTPDPSVVTQLLVAGPVTLLYLLGTGVAYVGARRRDSALAT
jgi:sec-independent protein translocase protein TatC